ncbi:MAG TPA: metallophosphoesterase, partial [Hanamia sp.]
MNIKYFLKLLIASAIFIATFAGVKYTGNGHTKLSANNNGLTRNDSTPTLSSFLVVSDIHLNSSASQADAHGDTGDSLWIAAKKEIDTIITDRKPRFIIVLGDLPMHDTLTKRDSVKVRQNIAQVIKYFKDSAGIPAGIPLVFVPGNNDSWNGDYSALTLPDSIYKVYGYPFINVDSTTVSDHACVANDSLQRLGCFSIYPLGSESKLKLIVLNTIVFTKSNGFPYSPDTLQQSVDATTQINWFLRQMEQA